MSTDQSELEYAGFWIRVAASLIDSILVLLVAVPLMLAFVGPTYWTDTRLVKGGFGLLVEWLLPAIGVLAFWIAKGATPGKMAISARIVDATTGQPPGTGQLVIRYCGYYLSMLPMFLGFIWVAFDRRKQGWHDKLANTVVVRRHGPEPVRFDAG
ncbi:MAG: RDD family protein [Steroidobacteraceae bacterium]